MPTYPIAAARASAIPPHRPLEPGAVTQRRAEPNATPLPGFARSGTPLQRRILRHDRLGRAQSIDRRADDTPGVSGPFPDRVQSLQPRRLTRGVVASDAHRRAAARLW